MPGPTRDRDAGLCTRCGHARVQRSAKGSEFWRCLRADSDARYLRYPPLPVTACPGFEPSEGAGPAPQVRTGRRTRN